MNKHSTTVKRRRIAGQPGRPSEVERAWRALRGSMTVQVATIEEIYQRHNELAYGTQYVRRH